MGGWRFRARVGSWRSTGPVTRRGRFPKGSDVARPGVELPFPCGVAELPQSGPIRSRSLGRRWLAAALSLACVGALSAPLAAGADSEAQALLAPALLEAAQAEPDSSFDVIVQGGQDTASVDHAVRSAVARDSRSAGSGSDPALTHRFVTIPGVAATLSGSQLVALAGSSEPLVITLDTQMTVADEVIEAGTAAHPIMEPVGPPTNTAAPAVLGTAEEDQTLSAAHGSWDGAQPFDFAYQWQRCDTEGESCSDIEGAHRESYKLRRHDVGTTVRLLLTVRNLAGEATAVAAPTSEVLAVPEPHPRFKQHWPYVAGVASLHTGSAQGGEPPTIAIVDSGIDADRADFGGRVVEHVRLTERVPNSPGDGNGHGTAVASVAAGEAEGYTGAAPDARLVSIDVLDDDGVGKTSDVIEAADWIYENRERLNIRVANFSLHGTSLASLVSDPLDKAVERLWLSGIVVVAASGNYAVDGQESAVPFAPGNDPFVITVGATDTGGSFTKRDDAAAPWSAWGYTRDGFAKPELVAPGRYIAAAVSPTAKLARDRPERIVEPGYLQLSGTSLAAPVVSGTAATILGSHPEWSPDQVKGALMLTAEPLPRATPRSAGVGALNAAGAAAVLSPPNPNLALNQFLVPDPEGGPTPVFDTPRWTQVVTTDPAWASVAWGSVAWGSAAWSSVAWGSVAWGSAAWGSVAWGSVAWGSVAWGSVAWGSHARHDVHPAGGYWVRGDA
jgi:serine protease AprX